MEHLIDSNFWVNAKQWVSYGLAPSTWHQMTVDSLFNIFKSKYKDKNEIFTSKNSIGTIWGQIMAAQTIIGIAAGRWQHKPSIRVYQLRNYSSIDVKNGPFYSFLSSAYSLQLEINQSWIYYWWLYFNMVLWCWKGPLTNCIISKQVAPFWTRFEGLKCMDIRTI